MSSFKKCYQQENVLRFPLLPGTQEIAWRYIFDWAIAGESMKCAPGDWVLELGAGSCFASEWFNRLGYYTVSLDLNPEILDFARGRWSLDQRLDVQRSSFVAGDGQLLPFADSTFDGVICLNALHHMPDYTATLREIRRVLKPGGRAVFSEPGSMHADAPESKMAAAEYGAVEKSIHLGEINQIAHQVGFVKMIVKPQIYSHLVELDYDELEAYRALTRPSSKDRLSPVIVGILGQLFSWIQTRCGVTVTRTAFMPAVRHTESHILSPYLYPHNIADFLEQAHAIFVLVAPGEKPLTSARPGKLQAKFTLLETLPEQVRAGEEISLRVRVQNTGDTLWLHRPSNLGGYVTLGVKIRLPNGRLLFDEYGRTELSCDVLPGDEVEIASRFTLPDIMLPGDYVMVIDMVDERITWFEQQGSPTLVHNFTVYA